MTTLQADVAFRYEVTLDDRAHVRTIIESTGFFHPPEVDIAVELVDDRLAKGKSSDYSFVTSWKSPRRAHGSIQVAPRGVSTFSFSADAGAEVVVRLASVEKRYRMGEVDVFALRGIDLVIARGSMVAIMGPSGCGKTTLLNSLSGLDDIDSGTVLIEGVDITTMADDRKTEFRARDMGFVFQTYNLLPVLTAAENVELPLIVSGTKPKVARQMAEAALAKVTLAGRENDRREGRHG